MADVREISRRYKNTCHGDLNALLKSTSARDDQFNEVDKLADFLVSCRSPKCAFDERRQYLLSCLLDAAVFVWTNTNELAVALGKGFFFYTDRSDKLDRSNEQIAIAVI